MVSRRAALRTVLAVIVATASWRGVTMLPAWTQQPRFWWRTPDEVAATQLDKGDFAVAAAIFGRPDWRGVACYRAGDWACADAAFALAAADPAWQAEAAFNRGNVAARSGRLTQALAHYDAALASRPDWPAARDNRARVAAAIAAQAQRERQRDEGGEPVLTPDGTVIDESGKHGKPGRLDVATLDADALQAIWLRNVRTDPAAFLRLRFAQEAQQTAAGGVRP